MYKDVYNEVYTAAENLVWNRKSNTLGSLQFVLAVVHRAPVDC